jgi:TM2 domain-containing membrane protein YozV
VSYQPPHHQPGPQQYYAPAAPVQPMVVGPLPGDKSPGLAALLSFLISGLGQVYTGDVVRGITLFSIEVLGAIVGFVLILLTFGFAAIVIVPVMLAFWIFVIVDASNMAQRRNAANRSVLVAPVAPVAPVSPQAWNYQPPAPAPALPVPATRDDVVEEELRACAECGTLIAVTDGVCVECGSRQAAD